MKIASSVEEVHVVHVVFEVLRIDLPIGSTQHSRKIWNHVDELRIDADQSAQLVRNGVRIGVASTEAWPAISTIAKAVSARTREERLFAQSGLPVTLVVDALRDAESVFSYSRANRLVGKTFAAGEKLVILDYAFRPELGGSTDLRIEFEVRHDSGNVNWERQEGVIRQVPEVDRHVYSELASELTLRPTEFLVIGPSEKIEHQHLVGGSFFTREMDGHRYETLFCITPKPYQSRESLRQAS